MHELTKRLDRSPEGNVGDDEVELPSDEITSLADDRFVKLLNQRSLADAGVTGHQHQGTGALAGALERADQLFDLCISAIELLRNEETV